MLDEAGRQVKAGDACAVVESVKTANDIYSPVSGEVTEANQDVVADPALVNSLPGVLETPKGDFEDESPLDKANLRLLRSLLKRA